MKMLPTKAIEFLEGQIQKIDSFKEIEDFSNSEECRKYKAENLEFLQMNFGKDSMQYEKYSKNEVSKFLDDFYGDYLQLGEKDNYLNEVKNMLGSFIGDIKNSADYHSEINKNTFQNLTIGNMENSNVSVLSPNSSQSIDTKNQINDTKDKSKLKSAFDFLLDNFFKILSGIAITSGGGWLLAKLTGQI